jgi:hypothetical protein
MKGIRGSNEPASQKPGTRKQHISGGTTSGGDNIVTNEGSAVVNESCAGCMLSFNYGMFPYLAGFADRLDTYKLGRRAEGRTEEAFLHMKVGLCQEWCWLERD